jgi:hypothetical protein
MQAPAKKAFTQGCSRRKSSGTLRADEKGRQSLPVFEFKQENFV